MDDHLRAFILGGQHYEPLARRRNARRYLVSDPNSLLLYVDRDIAITYQRETGHAYRQAAWSVLCDTGSPFNRAGHVPRHYVQSIEVAELFALASSLEVALDMVRAGWKISRVVICTHSQFLVDRICDEAWAVNAVGWPVRVTGQLEDWIHILHDCHLMTQALFHGRGVEVKFWQIPVRHLVETHGLLEPFL
ncbi:hypothetical protein VTL71DRAFT_2723 [Oculimacula yallundae]|uniref:RNase H type-1 domain-containing protein n=1 Tax=Oculimacula yallundae TaxID=86028 RepID=A0ABR4CB19_9HELO